MRCSFFRARCEPYSIAAYGSWQVHGCRTVWVRALAVDLRESAGEKAWQNDEELRLLGHKGVTDIGSLRARLRQLCSLAPRPKSCSSVRLPFLRGFFRSRPRERLYISLQASSEAVFTFFPASPLSLRGEEPGFRLERVSLRALSYLSSLPLLFSCTCTWNVWCWIVYVCLVWFSHICIVSCYLRWYCGFTTRS